MLLEVLITKTIGCNQTLNVKCKKLTLLENVFHSNIYVSDRICVSRS